MKKVMFFMTILEVIVMVSGAEARYKRKIMEPSFFIPEESKMHQPEKIPQRKILNQEYSEDTNSLSVEPELMDIKGLPNYKYKYNEYINDIMVFYNTDKMPENKALEKDLNAMNSNERIEVESPAPDKITSKEMNNFYDLYRKILEN